MTIKEDRPFFILYTFQLQGSGDFECRPGCNYNGFVETHTLGHMMYGYTLLVPMTQSAQQAKKRNII